MFRPIPTIGAAVLLVLPVAQPAEAAGPRPDFQAPFPCGQQIRMESFGHAPALDIFRIPTEATEGNPLIAPAPGVVNKSYSNPEGAGNVIQIDHGGDWFTTYIHLQSRAVQVGDRVERGTPIGRVGHTGETSNGVPHVHFEMAIDRNGDGEAEWGHPNPERLPPVFDGVTYGQSDGQTWRITSNNCATATPVARVGSSGVTYDGRLHTFFHGTGNEVLHHIYTAGVGWRSLAIGDGTIASRPTAVVHAGRLWVFARGTDGILQYRVFSTEDGWSSRWYDAPGGFAGAPTAAVLNDKMFVFIRSGQQVFYRYNDADTGWDPAGWRELQAPSGVAVESDVTPMILAGRLWLFVRGSDGKVWVRGFKPSINPPWTNWFSLPGAITGQPTAAVNGNTVWVFGRTATGSVRYHTYTEGDTSWHTDYALGGNLASDPIAIGVENRMTILGRTASGTITYRVRDSGRWTSTDWLFLDPSQYPLDTVSAPAATRYSDGIIVYARASNGVLNIKSFLVGNGGWGNWSYLGGTHSPIP